MLDMPELVSERLKVRRFTPDDLPAIHRVYMDAGWAADTAAALEERRRWLAWTVLNYDALAELYQPPYGDRAVVLRASGEMVGAVGLVPGFGPFGQLGYFQQRGDVTQPALFLPEVGLFYALAAVHQGHGYAVEAARLLVGYAFNSLNLKHIVATTEYSNAASIGVMRRLGMIIERNPLPEPEWFQVVGILENTAELS